MTDDILVSKQDGIATVTFNRPRQSNAISYHGWLELRHIAMDLDRDPEVRVVVFTGAGDAAFSAGADIKDFQDYRDNSEKAVVYAEAFDGAMDAIEAMSKPTICLIKGFCVGGGCELSMATDIRIAADNSRFGIPVARLSILVGYKEMRRLVQLVGPGNAAYILLSARLIDAEEAHRIGLVTQTVPLEEVSDVAYDLAREMSRWRPCPRRASGTISRALTICPKRKICSPSPTSTAKTSRKAAAPSSNAEPQTSRAAEEYLYRISIPLFTDGVMIV